MSDERCLECRFFESEAEDSDIGRCVRYPPVIVAPPMTRDWMVVANVTDFPVTSMLNWCGEWSAK